MAKKVRAVIKLQIEAGKANPAPPVGPALGQHGVRIMGFCKDYNEKTSSQAGAIVPVELQGFENRSCTFTLKTAPGPDLPKTAAGVEKGSGVQLREKAGEVTHAQIRTIAEAKMRDLNAKDLEGAMLQIEGTARSMGIEVV